VTVEVARRPSGPPPARPAAGWLAVSAAWVMLVALTPGAAAIGDPDRLWRVGSGSFADKLYPTARQTLEHLIARYPDDPRVPEAWLLLGKARLAQGDLAPALEAFRRAQTFQPMPGRSQEGKFWEAETLARLGRYEEARAAYSAVVRTDEASPLAPDAVYGLGWLEIEHGHPDGAVGWFRRLLETWPDDHHAPAVTYALARSLVELKRYGEAVPLLVRVLQGPTGAPHAAEARYLLGVARLGLDQTGPGMADLRAFVAANPAHELVPAARLKILEGERREALERARAAFKRKRLGEALAAARAATQSEEPDVRGAAWLLVGDAETERHRYGDALEAFEAADGSGGSRDLIARARAGRAVAHEKLGHWAEALRLYREAAVDGSDPQLAEWAGRAMLALAEARLGLGDIEPALDTFRRARQLTPQPGRPQEARYWEAEALLRLRRTAEARAAFDAVLASDAASPFASEAAYALASLDLEQKRPEAAVARLRELLEAWPESSRAAEAAFTLGRTLVELARYQEARPLLERFLERHPRHPRAADARYLLGRVRLATGDAAAGIAELRAFAAANPAHELAPAARRAIVEALLARGDRRELAVEYRTLMSVRPEAPAELYDAGAIAAELGQGSRRDAAWNRLRQKFPDHELSRRAALAQARTSLERKRYDEALGLARVASGSADAETRAAAALVTGEAELARQRPAAALKAFEATTGAGRQIRERGLAGRALASEQLGQWREALKLYQEVAAGSPDIELRHWAEERALAVRARSKPSQRKPVPGSS
jgi:tetratricopeptide (TPR) repeat protein